MLIVRHSLPLTSRFQPQYIYQSCSAGSMSYFSESGNVHRMPPRCFPGCIPALQPGTVSEEEMRRNRTHGASSNVGFLDSGNGTAPRCLRVALTDQTSLLPPRGLSGLQAHLDWHQSVTLLRENTLQQKAQFRHDSFRRCLSLFKSSLFAHAARLRRQFNLHLHLSWSSCGCNLSWSRLGVDGVDR